MKSRNDCGTLQGDGHGDKKVKYINDWRLAGITGNKKGDKDVLECANATSAPGVEQDNCAIEDAGDKVTYYYTITNNSTVPITVNLEDDKKIPDHAVASNILVPGKVGNTPGVKKYSWGPIAINSVTTNVGSVRGVGAANQCTADDSVVVSTPCFLGNPQTGQLYPYGTLPERSAVIFNESETLRALEPRIATLGDTIRMWYSDEHAMLLGIRAVATRPKGGVIGTPVEYPVTKFTPRFFGLADEATNPATGATEDQDGTDPAGRPIPPSLFCTDITTDSNSIKGDWQMGGKAQGPQFISGTWKSAVVTVDNSGVAPIRVITTDADPAANNLTLGPNANKPPANMSRQGYVTEARWNVNTMTCNGVALQRGHTYRMQFMVHDGDQNKTGGDVGEACATVIIPQ